MILFLTFENLHGLNSFILYIYTFNLKLNMKIKKQ